MICFFKPKKAKDKSQMLNPEKTGKNPTKKSKISYLKVQKHNLRP